MQGAGCRVQGVGCRVSRNPKPGTLNPWVHRSRLTDALWGCGAEMKDSIKNRGLGFRIWGLGFRVQGSIKNRGSV